MSVATGAKRGRPATATREHVVRSGRRQYLRGQRVDVTVLARDLGLGRATIYRWFGSRDGLVGEIIATELEQLVSLTRPAARRRRPAGGL